MTTSAVAKWDADSAKTVQSASELSKSTWKTVGECCSMDVKSRCTETAAANYEFHLNKDRPPQQHASMVTNGQVDQLYCWACWRPYCPFWARARLKSTPAGASQVSAFIPAQPMSHDLQHLNPALSAHRWLTMYFIRYSVIGSDSRQSWLWIIQKGTAAEDSGHLHMGDGQWPT